MTSIEKFIGDFIYHLSDLVGIEPKFLALIFMIIVGIPHFITIKNWKNSDSSLKFWAKLWFIAFMILLIAAIFD